MKRQILTLITLSGSVVACQAAVQSARVQAATLQATTAQAMARTAFTAGIDVREGAGKICIPMQGDGRAGFVPDRSIEANIDYSGKVKLKP